MLVFCVFCLLVFAFVPPFPRARPHLRPACAWLTAFTCASLALASSRTRRHLALAAANSAATPSQGPLLLGLELQLTQVLGLEALWRYFIS